MVYFVRGTGGVMVRRTRGRRALEEEEEEEVGSGGLVELDDGSFLVTVFVRAGVLLTALVALAMPFFISVEL